MSKRAFTDDEIKELSKNPFIKSIGERAITYTKEFKEYFIKEKNSGIGNTEIFKKAGFDTKILGSERIKSFSKRIKKNGVEDTRKGNSGRPRIHDKKELNDEETIKLLKHEKALLEQENEFLKKMIFLGRKTSWMKSLQEKNIK